MKSAVDERKNLLKRVMICFVLIGSLLVTVGFGEDEDSIRALRNMGKAFAQIAEQTSPAVVGIKAEQVYERQGSSRYESPFGDPFFDDDFFASGLLVSGCATGLFTAFPGTFGDIIENRLKVIAF